MSTSRRATSSLMRGMSIGMAMTISEFVRGSVMILVSPWPGCSGAVTPAGCPGALLDRALAGVEQLLDQRGHVVGRGRLELDDLELGLIAARARGLVDEVQHAHDRGHVAAEAGDDQRVVPDRDDLLRVRVRE